MDLFEQEKKKREKNTHLCNYSGRIHAITWNAGDGDKNEQREKKNKIKKKH